MSGENHLSVMPPTTTYQDLPASYSASFNFPAQCDSTLLTPISGSSSPPLQSLTKSSRRYGVSGSPEQQPSPPVNTTMLPWYYSTGSRPNQTASPLHQSTGSEFAAPAYMPENRRTPMPPIQQYVGTYGVSNAQEYQHNPYYQDQHEGSSPDVLDTRMHMNTQRGSVGAYSTGMTLPSQHLPDYRGSEATLNFSRSLDPGGMSNTPRQRGVRGARAQRARGRGGDTGRNSNHVGTRSPALSDWQNCHGKTVPPTLEDGIPEVERLLYELRWEHRDDKGQDMWRKIQGKIEDQLKFPLSAAALQMRYQRSRSAYIRWLDLDKEILVQAWKDCQTDHYDRILKRFLELGGSRNMDLSAKDIEYKLVTEHGLEEDLYMERFAETGLPVRRRVKIISQRPIKGNKHGMPREDELVPRLHYNAATHGLTHAEVLEQVHGHRSSTLDMTNVSAPDEYRVHASNGHDPMVKSEEED